MTGRSVARAIDALRHGWPVTIDGTGFLAVETADEEALAAFDASSPSDVLISANRAATLKLANQRDAAAGGPVRVARARWMDLVAATALADPALDLKMPLKGPFRAITDDTGATSSAALLLARRAGVLPALFVGGAIDADAASVTSAAIAAYDRPAAIRIASRAKLPVAAAESAEIVGFRSEGDGAEHVAVLIGAPNGGPPLVRIHSECLTGDALGSLKCDCGAQLDGALAAIAASGWGILLYLRQEGRGIGLINKLRAYSLQDQGFDTVEANLRLGFGDDERDFAIAGLMLKALGQDRVRLLTNNPRKVDGLRGVGVEVVERIPLPTAANPHNRRYLDTKRDRSGHRL